MGARRGKWKLVHTGSERVPWKLFDLENDIAEKKDLANENPDLVNSMVLDVENWAKTHVEPEWFHTLKARDQWKKANMPNNGMFRIK